MDTNLYEFLEDIKRQAQGPWGDAVINEAQWEWLTTFLRKSGTVIEFRSRETGRMLPVFPEVQLEISKALEPVTADFAAVPETEKHFAIAGTPDDVFYLLTEAMLLNPLFAQVVASATRAYMANAPICRKCAQRHNGTSGVDCPDLTIPSWEFKERKR
jgi:hypothetical protein